MKKFRAYLNILRMRLAYAMRRETIGHRPILAFVDPTQFCNLRCPACPTGLRSGLRPHESMDWDLYRAFIDEIGDYLFYVNFFNSGEPLLHKKVPEMIGYAKKMDIIANVSTNLSLNLSDDFLERLVRSGLDQLQVCVDGLTQETYGRYRRGGNLALVRRNMLRIQEIKARLDSRFPQVVGKFIVFQHNEHEVDRFRSDFRLWGADACLFNGGYVPDSEIDSAIHPSTMEEFNLYDLDSIEKAVRRAPACTMLYGSLVLHSGGTVSPCCLVAAEKDDFAGYSKRAGFRATWNSEKFRAARLLFRGRRRALAGATTWFEVAHRIDGMGGSLSRDLGKHEVICQRCPIPHHWDAMDRHAGRIATNLVNRMKKVRRWREKIRCLVSLIMMGAPSGPMRQAFRILWDDLCKWLWGSVSLRTSVPSDPVVRHHTVV